MIFQLRSHINFQKGHQLLLTGKSVAFTINLVSLPVQFVETDAEIIRGKIAIYLGHEIAAVCQL